MTAVGVPVHETALVEALEARIHEIVHPGAGRSVYVLLEPEVGHGRPDLMLFTISANAFNAFLKRNLRVPSLAAARSLDPSLNANHLGISEGYTRSLRKSLAEIGWRNEDLNGVARIVHDVMAVEAKMSDWGRALRQVARIRGFVDRASIMMPQSKVRNVAPAKLEEYGVGLISVEGSMIDWRVPAPRQPTDDANRIWFLELLIRGLETGRAYKFSRDRNSSSALPSDSTRRT